MKFDSESWIYVLMGIGLLPVAFLFYWLNKTLPTMRRNRVHERTVFKIRPMYTCVMAGYTGAFVCFVETLSTRTDNANHILTKLAILWRPQWLVFERVVELLLVAVLIIAVSFESKRISRSRRTPYNRFNKISMGILLVLWTFFGGWLATGVLILNGYPAFMVGLIGTAFCAFMEIVKNGTHRVIDHLFL